ncbi:MAG: sulfotransferase [Planctomycetes bacterium]|nr:sulfotransferase [Planctomycetota bacterium]
MVARESFGEKDKLRILVLTNPTKCNDAINPSIELRKQLEALQILDNPPTDIADHISLHVKINPGFPEIELASSISPSLKKKILPPDTELHAVVERADLIVAVNYFGAALVEVMRSAKPVIFLTTDRLTGAIQDVDPVFDIELLSLTFGAVSTEKEFWDSVRRILTDGKTAQQMHLQSRQFYLDSMDDSQYPTIGQVIKSVLSQDRVSQLEEVKPPVNDGRSAVRECKMEQLLPRHDTIVHGYSESNKKSSAGIRENKTMLSNSKTDMKKTNSPIFIGGMERSGTSLTRAVIGSHPDIAVYELDHQFWILNLPNEATYQWKKVCNQNLMKKMLDDFFSSEKYTNTLYKPDPERVYGILKGMDLDSIESCPVFVGKIFNVIMEEYRRLRNKKRWGFKSPWNEFHADAILSAYPDAKFLHVYRDVFSVSSSIKKTGWIKSDAAGFTRHTIKWNKSIELVLDNCQKYRGRYLGLNYDQFVLDPETYAKIICGFLNVRYAPVMLEAKDQPWWKGFGGSQTISSVPSQRPVNNLTEEEIDIINTVTQACQESIKERYPDFSIARMEARYLNELGEDFHSSCKDELAMIAFAKAAEVDPSYEGPFNNLGMLYEKQNDMSKALRYFIEALKLNSKNRSIVMNLGSFLRNAGKLNEAQKLYSNYLAQFPEDGEVLSERNKLCEISRLHVRSNSAIVNVSVIIPTHNRCSLLEKTIGSLVNQDFEASHYEILVIDNGSTDATRQVAEDAIAANREHNIRYIFEPEPGLLSGRHRGAIESKGDILVFIDDDIKAVEGWLSAIAGAFDDQAVHLVGGASLPEFEADPPRWMLNYWHKEPGRITCGSLSLIVLETDVEVEIDPNYVWGLNFSIRKKTLFELGGFHPDCIPKALQHFQGDGETGLASKIKAKGYKAIYAPGATVYHCIPKERMTVDYFKRRFFYQGVCDCFTQIRKNKGLRNVKVPAYKPEHPNLRTLPLEQQRQQVIYREVDNERINGFRFHLESVAKSPELLQWVLREDYFDYKLPDLTTVPTGETYNLVGQAR